MLVIITFLSVAVMILDARQKRAEELRRLTDKSASMSEEQLTELRADIKVPSLLHFDRVLLCVTAFGPALCVRNRTAIFSFFHSTL